MPESVRCDLVSGRRDRSHELRTTPCDPAENKKRAADLGCREPIEDQLRIPLDAQFVSVPGFRSHDGGETSDLKIIFDVDGERVKHYLFG
jgi:hypothetical protein